MQNSDDPRVSRADAATSEKPFCGNTRWRGFNLPNLCFTPGDFRFGDMVVQGYGRFFENEFRWIADWGFNWVRLPVSYDWYVRGGNPWLIEDDCLRVIDDAVTWGERYNLHVNLGLIHAPGYVNGSEYFLVNDPFDLWRDQKASDCFNLHWETFAKRYKGIPPERLSFCLLAEPARTDTLTYGRVMRSAQSAIRSADPSRPIVIEGLHYGKIPQPDLLDVGSVHCCRGYAPVHLSHRLAWWVADGIHDRLPQSWPTELPPDCDREDWITQQPMNESQLRDHYNDWRLVESQGMPIHCAEMGFWNRTPHAVGLAWMECLLGMFKEWGFGWALWNFTGSFGILDSGRTDVRYKQFQGHLLDADYLDLLQRM